MNKVKKNNFDKEYLDLKVNERQGETQLFIVDLSACNLPVRLNLTLTARRKEQTKHVFIFLAFVVAVKTLPKTPL